MLELLKVLFNLNSRELTWKDYMGEWKAPCKMSKNDDPKAYDASSVNKHVRASNGKKVLCGGVKKDEFI